MLDSRDIVLDRSDDFVSAGVIFVDDSQPGTPLRINMDPKDIPLRYSEMEQLLLQDHIEHRKKRRAKRK